MLYANITGCSNFFNVVVTRNHDSPIATAVIECKNHSLSLGSPITVDFGYSDDHAIFFTGYVKQIERSVREDTYTITAYDTLVRAQDYFIASSNPLLPFKRQNILAEGLVEDLLGLSGLSLGGITPTYFTFGIQNPFEINLVGCLDYVKNVCDLLTWNIWAEPNGVIYFKNRKPYVMTGTSGQPGDTADTPIANIVIDDLTMLSSTFTTSERSLRNRVVVYGASNIYAERSAESPYLPEGFFKSSVLAYPQFIDSQGLANDIAEYNLDLQNRIVETFSVILPGSTKINARKVVEVSSAKQSLSGNFYVFGCDQNLSSAGFTTQLELRRMVKV